MGLGVAPELSLDGYSGVFRPEVVLAVPSVSVPSVFARASALIVVELQLHARMNVYGLLMCGHSEVVWARPRQALKQLS